MCILLIKSDLNPESGGYRLILVNIRDEYFMRPTQKIDFWDNQLKQIIGAKDLQEGREGGTWLAMNTNGKVGILLNIFQPREELSADKKSRGFLVVDYLNSDSSPKQYLNELTEQMVDYNGFRMIAMHIKPQSTDISVFSNIDGKVVELDSGIHGFGNNKIEDQLWTKVKGIKERFEDIVNKYNNTSAKQELIDSIFKLLSDKTKYPLDQQIKTQGNGKSIEFLERLNSINVFIPECRYGSRTRTIILVDSNLNVDYIEKTMKDPIDVNNDIQWITTEKKFKIQ